jgi:2-oxoglutarate dehydrogenase E1 component
VRPGQAKIQVWDSPLSEYAVVGFEFGYSLDDPMALVAWEAQFGDFANGAQVIIDQFLTSGESKWQRASGLVMLLPHGFEGQGPEHSSARLERFLQMCAEDNVQVVNATTPAQYFHLLRRQMKRNFRKPLISFMPKSLLRAEASSSMLEELAEGTFQLVMDDPANPPRERVRRLLFCSGKVYFALDAARRKHQVGEVAIVRVEQLYPFPKAEIQSILARYRNAQEICWVQEEPRNRGAWMFMQDRLQTMIPETAVLKYVGREEAASPATGSYKLHEIEAEELLTAALDLPPAQTNGNGNGAVVSAAAAPAAQAGKQ